MKRIVLRLSLLLSGAVIGCLMAEFAARLLTVPQPQPYQPDVWVGARLQPGFRARFQREGDAWVTINQAGFRDREHALTKPPGTFRVAILGDSFAEAVQVPLEETFWSVLESELNRRQGLDGRTVEVLNFGISGHGTAQQLQMLRHYVWPYQPDLVLLAFFAGNDIRNNAKQLEPDLVRPFFRLEKGDLVLDDSFLKHPEFLKASSAWVQVKVRLINASRLLQLLQQIWRRRRVETVQADRRGDALSEKSSMEAGLNDQFLVPQEPPTADDSPARVAWREAWQLTDQLVLAIRKECQQHQASFAVVLITLPIQVHPDPQVRERFARELGVVDLNYPARRLSALGADHDFLVIDLAPSFCERAEREGQFTHGFANTHWGTGHWNAVGHRWAGELIATELQRSWLIERKSARKVH